MGITLGTLTPLLAWFTIKRLVLDPYQARKRDQERERRREANREKVAEARREALASASLMAQRFTRSDDGSRLKELALTKGTV